MGKIGVFGIVISFLFATVAMAETVIPFDSVAGMYGSGAITVPCNVNGQDFKKCKLDTGAIFSSVKKDLLLNPGEVINQVPVMSFSGQVVTCDTTVTDALKIQGLGFGKSLLLLCPQLESSGADVIIGLDILTHKPLILDYKKNQFILDAAKPTEVMNFTEDESGHILLPVTLHKQKPVEITAMFDSGAAITVVDVALVKAHPEIFTIIQDNSVTDTHGNVIPTLLVIASNLRVGQASFVAEFMMAVDLSATQKASGQKVTMILGHNITIGANWYFSFVDHTWSAN